MNTREGLVVVTGASRGVGRATAEALAREHGRRVLAVARDSAALASLSAAHPLVQGLVVDLEREGAAEAVSRAVGDRPVAALVNNAGLLIKNAFPAWTEEDLVRLYRVNVVLPLRLVQALLDRLEGRPEGHVVNIGSMGGVQGSSKFPGLLGYSTSKGALVTATECLAEELKDRGVRANCVCLGSVDTEMLRQAFPGYKASMAPGEVGAFLSRFALEGGNLFNGKVLHMATGTP
jgi:3-oxoacyl-[acyl-carrier protein] reductase